MPALHLPRQYRDWVLDRGSLTKRLIRHSGGDFRVRLVALDWARPELDERQALGMSVRDVALIREVELICRGEIWVRARSVIPVTTLSGEERLLGNLGNRPLGAFLFRARTMQRKGLQLASVKQKGGQWIIGRRSVFLLHQKPLLVCEFFMPPLLNQMAKLK